MTINFVTLFPNYFIPFINESITKRAIGAQLLNVNVIDFRDYADDKHGHVDDIVYGGGHGMLLKVAPIHQAIKDLRGKKILLSPQGQQFTQAIAKKLSQEQHLTFIAGHYEGFDERVRDYVDLELSIGDYVLTGGELPAMVIADAIVRLLPGVINANSHENDSFQNHLLDYAQYTKPRVYENKAVPEVLLNGNHALIKKWRLQSQITKTKKQRPDLFRQYQKGENNEK